MYTIMYCILLVTFDMYFYQLNKHIIVIIMKFIASVDNNIDVSCAQTLKRIDFKRY